MTKSEARKRLIEGGVRGVKDFGYPMATEENILTDYIFRTLFRKQLENTKEDMEQNGIKSGAGVQAVDELMAEIDACTEPA